jgi:hypothetical protein
MLGRRQVPARPGTDSENPAGQLAGALDVARRIGAFPGQPPGLGQAQPPVRVDDHRPLGQPGMAEAGRVQLGEAGQEVEGENRTLWNRDLRRREKPSHRTAGHGLEQDPDRVPLR